MNLMDLYIKISCQDEASDEISSLGSKVQSGLATVAKVGTAAVAAAATATVALGKSALDAYASYEQLTGGVETLFKESASTVEAYAANAYQTAGMSANAYMETVTSFSASLLQGLGGDTAAAAEYANLAVTDMADNANKMGTAISSIQDAYQGFAKQNYTMLDNLKLGYGGTASEMARLINDSGVLGDTMEVTAETVNSVSFDQMVEAIHVIQTEMGITGTTAEEASHTIEGSVSSMKAAWENWLTALGRDDVDMGEMTQQLVDAVVTAGENIIPRIGVIAQNIGTTFVENLPAAMEAIKNGIAELLPESLRTPFNDAISSLSEVFGQLGENLLSMIGPAQDSLSSIGSMFGSAFDVIVSVVNDTLLPAFERSQPLLQSFIETIQSVFSAAVPVVENAITLIAPLISQAVDMFEQVYTAISQVFEQIASAVFPAVETIATALSNLANAVLPVLASAIQIVMSVVQAILPVLTNIASVVSSVLSVVITVVSSALSIIINSIATVVGVIGNVMAVISAVVGVVSTVVGTIASIIGGFVSSSVATVSGFVNAVVSSVASLVNSVLTFFNNLLTTTATIFQSITSTLLTAAQTIYTSVTNAFSDLVSSVTSKINDVMTLVSGIPNRILSALGDLGSLLFNSGASLLQGLLDGVNSMIGTVAQGVSGALDTIRSYFPFSPAKRGPFAGRGYTTYSGKALMEDFAGAIEEHGKDAEKSAYSALDKVSSAFSEYGGGIGNASFSVSSSPVASAAVGASQNTTNNLRLYINDVKLGSPESEIEEKVMELFETLIRLGRL